MKMDVAEFCFYLEEWKKGTGKKDKDFCQAIGIHPNTLVNWKKSKSEPRAEHMQKLCYLLDIREVDLDPKSFYTAQDNANKLYYRSQQLQRYAKAKGLDEDFYKRMISKPYFLREFPFSSVESRFYRLRCPMEYEKDEKYIADLNAIPLAKYEFVDDYGNIVMLAEDDIDFMVNLQNMSEQLIRDQLYLERHRKEEKRFRDWATYIAASYLEDGDNMDPNKLYAYVTRANVKQRDITGGVLWERFEEYCKSHNVQHKPYRQIMLESVEDRHPQMEEEERKAWREYGIASGLSEEEIDSILRQQDYKRILTIEFEKHAYRTDDKESDNDGQH